MKLQNRSIIGLLTLVLLFSITTGHFFPPMGVLLIPVVVSLMIGLLVFIKSDLNIIEKSVLSYLCIGLNDIGIKLFSGGRHDLEGLGWIHMMLFIGLVPCFMMLLISIFRDKSSSVWLKALSVAIFMLLICLHVVMFETLGVEVS
jgi:hypothetical protein